VVLWALSSRAHAQRQFWHDAWAGTQLIDTRGEPMERPAP
jgi:hypothetical protein